MRIIDSMPAGTGKRARYPWNEWFDGQVRQLENGVDFTCTPEGLRTTIHTAAKRMGFKVTTANVEGDVYVHAEPVDDEPTEG